MAHEEKQKEARALYRSGVTLSEISKRLGVPRSTISRWKKEKNWKPRQKKQTNRLEQLGSKLNARQREFCERYASTRNVAGAYAGAYGCSIKTARVNGYRLMADKDVKRYITHLLKITRENVLLELDDLVDQMMRIAFYDIRDYVDVQDGNVNILDLRRVDGTVIAEIRKTEQGIMLKMADKLKALEWLGKRFGMDGADDSEAAGYLESARKLEKQEADE